MPPLLIVLFGTGLLVVAALTWALVAGAIRLAPVFGLLDRPNARSSHTRLTPRGGGVGIVLAVLLAVGGTLAAGVGGPQAGPIALSAGGLALFIAGISFSDDLRSLPSVLRLVCHLGTAAAAVWMLGAFPALSLPGLGLIVLPSWLAITLTLLWIVGLTNVYNFMDGIDGIAGVQGLAAGAAWTVLGALVGAPLVVLTGAAVTAACAGFLIHNWSPARIFMGDVGSAFLGFVFAVLPLMLLHQLPKGGVSADWVGALPVFAGLVVFPFVGDGTYTFLRRLRHGENVLSAHRSHLYQRLTISGWTHATVARLYAWWAAVAVLVALAYPTASAPGRVGLLVGALVSLGAVHLLTKVAEWRARAGVAASGLPRGPAGAQKPRIFLSPPHLGSAEFRLVTEAFETNWIAPAGPHLAAFEREFAARVGVAHAVSVDSGTGALHLAMRCVGVRPGDEVLVSSFTFVATANPIVYEGGKPVFIDSETESWNMDPALLAATLDERAKRGRLPRAVVVAHLYGQSANLGPILAACARHGVPLIEDAAEALGATYQGRAVGSFGRIGIFSFNGNKIITTSGGGMFVSNDKALVELAHNLATQARDPAPHYEHSKVGYNYRLSNVLAGIGRGQLQVLDDRVATRRRIYERYRAALAGLPGVTFRAEAEWGKSTRWLTCLTIDPAQAGTDRETVLAALEAANIEARPLWKPLHLQPVFLDMGCEVVGGAVSEQLFAQGLCLPSGSAMADADQDRVIGVVRRAFAQG